MRVLGLYDDGESDAFSRFLGWLLGCFLVNFEDTAASAIGVWSAPAGVVEGVIDCGRRPKQVSVHA